MSSTTEAIAEAWAVAESRGWEVVALVRHKSAPESRRWRAELVDGPRRAGAFGPTAEQALRNAGSRTPAGPVIEDMA